MTQFVLNSAQNKVVITTEGRAFIIVGPESQTAFTQVDRFVHLIDDNNSSQEQITDFPFADRPVSKTREIVGNE